METNIERKKQKKYKQENTRTDRQLGREPECDKEGKIGERMKKKEKVGVSELYNYNDNCKRLHT